MRERLFIGLMSGTSVDAIDAALVRVRGAGAYAMTVEAHCEHAWPASLRERLLRVMAPAETTTAEICELNFLVAGEFAKAVGGLLRAAKVSATNITALGSHGQTICHLPPNQKSPIKKKKLATPSTLQLGDASVLATLSGIPVVGNFRTADMAVGGQGAPLVPWADAMVLSDAKLSRAVQNIGGIANVTYLPQIGRGSRAAAMSDVIAFDTGPGNMLLDAVVSQMTGGRQRFDAGGRLAARGTLHAKLFRTLQAYPYFGQRPPKSTGREMFGMQLAAQLVKQTRIKDPQAKLESLMATLTRITAWSIADAYLHFLPELPDELILCGGGADNPTLVRMLSEELSLLTSDFTGPGAPVIRRIDEHGIPNKAKEAASFALLAAATMDGVPGNLPGVTGASRPVVLGSVSRPFTS